MPRIPVPFFWRLKRRCSATPSEIVMLKFGSPTRDCETLHNSALEDYQWNSNFFTPRTKTEDSKSGLVYSSGLVAFFWLSLLWRNFLLKWFSRLQILAVTPERKDPPGMDPAKGSAVQVILHFCLSLGLDGSCPRKPRELLFGLRSNKWT